MSQVTNSSGNPQALSGGTESRLAEDFSQKTNITTAGSTGGFSGVQTTYDPKIHPPMQGLGRHHHHHAYGTKTKSPFDRPSIFDVQSAYKKHHETLQSQGAQQQTQRSVTQQPTVASAPIDKAQLEAEGKAAKAEEHAELAKFEEIREHINSLITSQEWNKMESSHVFELGTKLRHAEQRFWALKPAAERLVLKGRNKLAERVDLAEEELLHAIIVVSHIYRERVMAAAHSKYPGKVHPKYVQEQQQLAQSHAYARRGAQHRGVPHQHAFGHPGHGHPGHPGYAGYEEFYAHPYHGHPHQGYGGYY